MTAPPPPNVTMPSFKRGESITLNFVGAEIDAVARAISILTGRNVVLDPRVRGTMTLNTEAPVPPMTAYNLFLGQLRLQGFAVVQTEGLDKVVPEADAKLQGGNVTSTDASNGKGTNAAGNQMLTQIIRLQYENASNLIPILRPLINPNNPINVNSGSNALIITDYADNLRRISKIIESLDTPNATDLDIVPLQYGNATEMQSLLQRLVDNSVSGGAANPAAGNAATADGGKTTILAEARTNSIILRAPNQAKLALARSLIKRLDQPTNTSNGAMGNIYVVYLKNASAVQLAATLRAAIAATAGGGSGAAAASAGAGSGGSGMASNGLSATASSGSSTSSGASSGTSSSGGSSSGSGNQPSTGGQIQADPSTNSLIITASEPQYRQLKAVIDKLDTRRAQVFVESLIAEVSDEKAAEFGIQWQGGIGNTGDAAVGILGTNFGSGGSNIVTLASAISSGSTSTTVGKGLNLGIGQKYGDTYVLGFLGRFLQTNALGNVLSTPNLLTLDNEEAKIVVGQNVPFVTGQYTGSSGSSSAFQTVERKDVGLTLKVKPQISENGSIRMAIYQEVSSVDSTTLTNTNGPTTNKRTIESSVVVEDGAIIVLGGLLSDTYSGSKESVPGLADIPLLGGLFRSESKSRKKTNLMVFLRPVILRDAESSEKLSSERYESMRSHQKVIQPTPSTGTNSVSGAPALPNRPTDAMTLRWTDIDKLEDDKTPATPATPAAPATTTP
ncbi:type II secretion system secretin GspD [Curvibacter sp. CHRR-16]|nr:type II secretion system secretin GspD [Curvibacter sp. CHRR-16]